MRPALTSFTRMTLAMNAALATNALFSLVSLDSTDRAAPGGDDVRAGGGAQPQGPFRTLRTGGSPRPPAALLRSVRTCAGDSLHFSRGVACSIALLHSTSKKRANLVPRSLEARREGFRRACVEMRILVCGHLTPPRPHPVPASRSRGCCLAPSWRNAPSPVREPLS